MIDIFDTYHPTLPVRILGLFQRATMTVGNNGVGVHGIILNPGNNGVGVRNIMTNGRNGCICIYWQCLLGAGG